MTLEATATKYDHMLIDVARSERLGTEYHVGHAAYTEVLMRRDGTIRYQTRHTGFKTAADARKAAHDCMSTWVGLGYRLDCSTLSYDEGRAILRGGPEQANDAIAFHFPSYAEAHA